MGAKIKQASASASGGKEDVLKQAREEMTLLNKNVIAAKSSVDALRANVNQAKIAWSKKEKTEVNAHIEAKTQRDIAPFLEVPTAKFEELDAQVKAAEAAASALVSLVGAELEEFATPASVLDSVELASRVVSDLTVVVKDAIKEQVKSASELSEGSPKPGAVEAKKRLNALGAQVTIASQAMTKLVSKVAAKCAGLVKSKLEATSSAIRNYAKDKNLSGDELFDSLMDGDKILEAAFCKLLLSLEECPLKPEVAKLIYKHLGKDGITRDVFLNHVVIYYKVTRTIAFTDCVEVDKCKTLRKCAINEVLELLEGPVKDEANGVTRIRVKAVKPPDCTGWITLAGNQGGAFLEKTKKS
jgi:hypothetical protein